MDFNGLPSGVQGNDSLLDVTPVTVVRSQPIRES